MHIHKITSLWQAALKIWSPYLRWPEPICLVESNDLHREGLIGQIAQFRLDSRQVLLNSFELQERRLNPYLLPILAHEAGHLLAYPGSLEQHTQLVARTIMALDHPEQHAFAPLIVNLYQDLLINTRLQVDKKIAVEPLLRALRPEQPNLFWNWVLRVYELRWRLPKRTLCWHQPDPLAEADAILVARMIQPLKRNVFQYMSDFTHICQYYLPEQFPNEPWLDLPQHQHYIPAGLGQSIKAYTEAQSPSQIQLSHSVSGHLLQSVSPAAYTQLLKLAGIDTEPVNALAQYYREQAWPWLLPDLSAQQAATESAHPEGVRRWEFDRPIADIDWIQSLVQSPVIVPGVTILRKHYAQEHQQPETHQMSYLDLYLDISGSVPDPYQSLSPLLVSASILTLSALRLQIPVRVTCFCEHETIIGTDFSNQEAVLMQTLLSPIGGATRFPLDLVSKRIPEMPKGSHVVIISDEGWPSLLQSTQDGRSGQEILLELTQSVGLQGALLLDLLKPDMTPSALEPLVQGGWQLLPIVAGQYQNLQAFFRIKQETL